MASTSFGGHGPAHSADNSSLNESHHSHSRSHMTGQLQRAVHREESMASLSQTSGSAGGGSGSNTFMHGSNSVTSAGGLAPSFTSSTLADHFSPNTAHNYPGGTGTGYSAATANERPGRGSASASTVGTGTEAMMSSAGQMLIGSVTARIVEKVRSQKACYLYE
jgi:hypothetical protein